MIEKTPFVVCLDLINQASNSIPYIDSKFSINEPTGDFFYDPWKIKEEFKGTGWEEILTAIKQPIGEARIIKLEPGTCYFSHADIDDRWHLSLTGNQSFLIDLENQKMHKLSIDGVWYIMDAGRCHTAANFGQIHRNQLVVRNLLKRNELKNPVSVMLTQNKVSYDFRYLFDNEISPWLNRANTSGKINNFRTKEHSVQFDIEKELVSELKMLSNNFVVV